MGRVEVAIGTRRRGMIDRQALEAAVAGAEPPELLALAVARRLDPGENGR